MTATQRCPQCGYSAIDADFYRDHNLCSNYGFFPGEKKPMVAITHDWDTSDPVAELEQAFAEYRAACYGNTELPATQLKEVRQAFFSGVHWLNSQECYDPDELVTALRELCGVK